MGEKKSWKIDRREYVLKDEKATMNMNEGKGKRVS